jgi:cytochrome P450
MALAGPMVAVADPDAVEALLEADPGRARAGEARRNILPMAAERSVLGGDGDSYMAAHRRLAPALAPEAMARRHEPIAAIARRHVAAWPHGRPIQLLSRVRAILDEVFVRQVLGVDDEERAPRLAKALGSMLRTPGNPPVTLPGRRGDGPLGAAGRAIFAQRKASLQRQLTAEVEARRGRERGLGDAIDSLLGAEPTPSSEEIVEELITLAMAAQEPPSIALTWTLERLARHPQLAADYLAAGHEGPLREAVFRETLRMRPPALAALRCLDEPFQAGVHLLPAGTATFVPLPLIQRDPRAFPDPDTFRPERWLGAVNAPGLFRPFGGGMRRCIGEALARAEAAAVVPAVLEAVRIRPLWPRQERMAVRATTLVPHRSVPAIVSKTPSKGSSK